MCVTPGPKKRGYDFSQLISLFVFGLRFYATSGLLHQGNYEDYHMCPGLFHVSSHNNERIPVYSSASGVIIFNLTPDVLALYFLMEERISKYYVAYIESENCPHHLAATAMRSMGGFKRGNEDCSFTWTGLRESIDRAFNHGGFKYYQSIQERYGHLLDAKNIRSRLQSRGRTGVIGGKYFCLKLRKSAHSAHEDNNTMVGHGVSEGGLYIAPFDDERDNTCKLQISNDDNNDVHDEDDESWMTVDRSPDGSYSVYTETSGM